MDNNIIVRITSETDLTDAQLQMRNLTDRSKELEREMVSLKKAEEDDLQAVKARIAAGKESEEELQNVIRYNKELQQQKQKEINLTRQSIDALKKEVNAYNTVEGAGKRMSTQLREMREQLQRMEDAGQGNTQAFMDLAVAAARLQDQMGDTQTRIRVLASDTKNLDAAINLGSGIAGAFNVATSTMALFGGESEKLQEAFYKVQSAMAIMNGLQQVANVLNKDSAAMIVINTAYEKLRAKAKGESAVAVATNTAATTAETTAVGAETVATGAATKAQWSLNAAMAANPIGVIVAGVLAAVAAIAALTAGVMKLIHAFSESGKAEEEYKQKSEALEKVKQENALAESERAREHEKNTHAITTAENEELMAAEKRGAKQKEINEIKLKYAKQNREEVERYTNAAIRANNVEIRAAKDAMDAKKRQLAAAKKGSEDYEKLQKELIENEATYNNLIKNGYSLEDARAAARKAEHDAEQALKNGGGRSSRGSGNSEADQRKQYIKEANKIALELMKEGQAKELAQLKASYDEQLATIKGKTTEANNLRLALEKKYNADVEKVQEKFRADKEARRRESQKSELQYITDYYKAQVDALTGAEGVDAQLAAWENYYDARENQIRQNSKLEIAAYKKELANLVEAGSVTQEEANKMLSTFTASSQLKVNTELRSLAKELTTAEVDIYAQGTKALELEAKKRADAIAGASIGGRMDAMRASYEAQMNLLDAQEADATRRREKGLITEDQYQSQLYDIEKARIDAEAELEQGKMQLIADTFATVVDQINQAATIVFDAISSNIQKQMDELDEMYTTDAEEAKKNSKKKLITEEEYAKKKAALELKQQKLNKANALFEISMNTASAIMGFLANPGGTAGIVLSAMAGVMGAAQLGVAAAKPLPQYAKGRKGGKGEYALVGEKGPELMYVPQGASIVPNSKLYDQASWGSYGVPKMSMPAMPNTDLAIMEAIAMHQIAGAQIDYDRLGSAVAANIPVQKAVNVSIDRNGIVVRDGRDTHHYLNTKYCGSWR